jgi:hypothetical protein
MKYLKLLLFALLAPGLVPARSQTFSLEVNPGVGTFAMPALKELVRAQNQDNIVPTRVVQNYPAFLVFDLKALYRKENYWVGFDCKFMSSGARVSYRDYSGELRLDHVARAYAAGVCFKKPVWTKEKISLLLTGDLVFVRSLVAITSYVAVYDHSESETLGITSIGIGAQPGVDLRYRLGRFSVGINAGFFANRNAGLHLQGNKYAVLTRTGKEEPLRTNWSGFRGGLHLALAIR